MTNKVSAIEGGLYLVIDPVKGLELVLPAVQQALEGGVDIIQVWNHWAPGQHKIVFIHEVCQLAHAHGVPVFVHEDWQLMQYTASDGIHFDEIPAGIVHIRQAVGRPFLCGLTCGNDLQVVQWAIDYAFDYVSFCSMFPSGTANSCELVKVETVQAARRMTGIPIFVAGGITPEAISALAPAGMDGVAVVSGIMNTPDPRQSTLNYKQALYQLKQITP